MGVGTVTVVMAGVAAAADESSSAFSSSMRGTADVSDERSFRIFLLGETNVWLNPLILLYYPQNGYCYFWMDLYTNLAVDKKKALF